MIVRVVNMREQQFNACNSHLKNCSRWLDWQTAFSSLSFWIGFWMLEDDGRGVVLASERVCAEGLFRQAPVCHCSFQVYCKRLPYFTDLT